MKKIFIGGGVALLLSLTSCQDVYPKKQVARRIIGTNIPIKMSADTLPGKTEKRVDFIAPENLFE